MSWSISLNGSKQVVMRELEDAIHTLRHAYGVVENTGHETIDVSCSGHAWTSVDELARSCTAGGSFSVSGSTKNAETAPMVYQPETPQPVTEEIPI